MKNAKVKLLLALVIVIFSLFAMASCMEDPKCVVKVYDGTTLVKQYEFDAESTISIPAEDFQKPGYELLGFFTDSNLSQALDLTAPITEDISVYVSYRAKTLYMMVDDGTGVETRINVVYGENYELTAPVREGYRFINYSYMGEAFPLSGVYNYTNSIPVVAKWEKIVYLKVFDGVSVTTVEVASDGKYELPSVQNTADKTFGGYLNGAEAFGSYDETSGKWIGTYTGKEDVYLTYKWNVIPKYTLTVNGLDVAPKQYKNGEAYTLPQAPTREGYFFLGYELDGAIFAASGNYNFTKDVTVTAKWRRQATITVYKGTSVVETIKVPQNGAYTLTAGVDNADYTFAGFTVNGAAFAASGTYTGEADLTVMQVWNTIPKYTLTVNGLYGDDVVAPKQYKNGEAYTLPQAPTREGYFFLGYEANGAAFAASGNYGFTKDVTVTAKWRRQATITVYNGTQVVETIKVPVSGAYTLTAGTDTADYTFGGFTKGGVAFAASGTYTGEEDLIVMQVWNAIPKYTLTVNGLYGDDVVAPKQYKTGEEFTLPQAPTRDGYNFAGYTVNGTSLTLVDGKATFAWDDNTVVVANWTEKVYITVKDQYTGETLGTVEVIDGAYDLTEFVPEDETITTGDKIYTYNGFNNGSFAISSDSYTGKSVTVMRSWSGDDRIFINIISKGASYSFERVEVLDNVYTTLASPNLTGYFFIGYYTDEACTLAFENNGEFNGTESITVYAKWKKQATITVYNGAVVVETEKVDANGEYTLTAGEDNADYTFGGFTKGGEEFAASGTYTGEEDLIVMQVWIPKLVLTVNGLYGADAVPASKYKKGETFNLPIAPTRVGFNFTGYTTLDGAKVELTADGKAEFVWDKDTVIVANWTEKVYITVKDQYTGETLGTVEVIDGAYDLTEFVPEDKTITTGDKIYTYNGFNNGSFAISSDSYTGKSVTVMRSWSGVDRIFINIISKGASYSFERVEVLDNVYTTLASPSLTGYFFIGYYTDEACTLAFENNGEFNGTESITVYAKWEKIVYLKVFDGVSVNTFEVALDGKYELPNVQNTADNTFGGYLNGAEAFGSYDETSGKWIGTYTGKEDVYLTYKWNAIPKYTLTVNGLYGDDVVAPKQYKEGDTYNLPPEPTREGYFFLGYEANGASFAASGNYNFRNDVTVTAKWKKQATITVYNGAVVVETKKVDANGEYTLTAGVDNADYTFGGFTKGGVAFAASGTYTGEEDLIVMQVWIPKLALTVNGLYGDDVVATGKYKKGETFTLPVAPTREGHNFAGYTTLDGAKVELTADGKAEFVWDKDTVIVANWTEKKYVTIYDGETKKGTVEIVDETVKLPKQEDQAEKVFNGYEATGMTFTKNEDGTYSVSGLTDNVNVKISWYELPKATLDANGGVLTGVTGDTKITLVVGENTLPVPTREDYTFVGWNFGSEPFTDENGRYYFSIDALASGFSVPLVANWMATSDLGEVKGKDYFKELEDGEIIYVFLTGSGNKYEFENATLTFSGNNGVVTPVGNNAFIANKEGTFTMTATKSDGKTQTIKCKVERRITALESNKKDDEAYANNFLDDISSVIDAGTNNIVPDVRGNAYKGNGLLSITHSDVPTDIKVELWNGTSYELIETGYSYDGNSISFEDGMAGKRVRVTIVPTYSLSNDINNQTLVFEYQLNNGVNVYNNEELFKAFKDTNVQTINILREIKAQFDPSQCVDGNPLYPINYRVDGLDDNGIYIRTPGGDDNITINGNCYMIDASGAALFDAANGGLHNDGYCAKDPYYYLNIHAGIFMYHVDETVSNSHNANININDLYIKGNFDGDADMTDGSIAVGSIPTLRGSRSINGIVVRHGHLTVDNTRIDHTNVAIQSWGYDSIGSKIGTNDGYSPADPAKLLTTVKLNKTTLDVSFAQSVYAWGQVGVEVNASYLGQSSGAAFHFSDSPIVVGNENGGYLKLSDDTVINNFVSGSEAWFIAFGKGGVAGELKMMLNGMLEPYYTVTTPDGTSFNFIICVDSAGDRFGSLDPTTDNEQSQGTIGYMSPYYPIYAGDSTGEFAVTTPSAICGKGGFYLSNGELSIMLELFPLS